MICSLITPSRVLVFEFHPSHGHTSYTFQFGLTVPICDEPAPTAKPTGFPTENPTQVLTADPTRNPTGNPTGSPTLNPTREPTADPTLYPTNPPTNPPTISPTASPTNDPTNQPTTEVPTGGEDLVSALTESANENCSCLKGDELKQSFKCGNEIYLCPGVDKVCSTTGSRNSLYYPITQYQCNTMKLVEIDEKCVALH